MSESTSFFAHTAASTSSRSSIGQPEWTCVGCSAEGAAVELVEVDGNMVCPQCAMIDSTATSARGHVDISVISGQIVDPTQTLQTLQKAWSDRVSWNDRVFMAHVDTVLASLVSSVVGNSSYNLLNGSRLWFNDLRKAEHLDAGWKTMSTHIKTPKLVLQIALAVRMASQEMNLISMYNKLKGKRFESPKAIRGYTKGDDRVPVLGFHEYFDLNQQLPSSSPARLSNFKYWRQGTLRYEGMLEYALSPCDFFMSLVQRVITYLQSLVQASPEVRKSLLQTKPSIPKPAWPNEVFDDFRKIRDWDEVFRTVHELWQAQNCVSLLAEDILAVQAGAAVVLTIMACEATMGAVVKSNNFALETELSNRLRIGMTSCRRRRAEFDRFVLSWSTSRSELGLPVPSIKPSNRSSILGMGDSGWGSDKRRGVPKKVIMPLAIQTVASHWREIKKARLARPGVLPLEEECVLARRLFAGKDIAKELAELLAKSADPLLPSHDSDWGSDGDTESEVSIVTPSEMGFHGYSGDYASYVNPKFSAGESSSGPISRRFWRNVSQTPAPAPARALGVERFHSAINKPDMVQAWIENGDASSSEDGDSSEDEAANHDSSQPAAKRARHATDTSHVGELPQPFAFSIGKEGFSVEKTQSQIIPTPATTTAAGSSSASSSSRAQSVVTVNSEDIDPALGGREMVRQPSATPSATSTSSSVARRPAPLRATLTPAPVTSTNGALPSARAEREAIRRGRKHLNDHTGVLIREKKQYFQVGRTFETLRHAAEVLADTDVVKSIDLWLERQKQSGSIVRNATTARQRDSELRHLINTQIDRQSPLETLLRAGVGPKQIPQHLIPRSVCATNMDLFHYADRKAILGEGDVEETERLLDLSLRLFFRGFGNDTLPEVFLNPEEIKLRITSYHHKGFWDVLADPSPLPIPKFRKRKREVESLPENMIQRIASEFERELPSEQAEEEIIQQAVLAGLLVTKALHPWDPYKASATVPALWYLDDLFELGLVDRSKLNPQQAWETAESTWARRRKNEDRGEVSMPTPEGAGAVHLAKRGLVMMDGVVTKPIA